MVLKNTYMKHTRGKNKNNVALQKKVNFLHAFFSR